MILAKIIYFVIFALDVVVCVTETNKVTFQDDLIENYAEFLNFGIRKPKSNLRRENAAFKPKVEVLGKIFKSKISEIKAKDCQLDIVFLIDASSSIGEKNFQNELKFVRKLLSDVIVDYNHSRVAIVTYSSANKIIKSVDEISTPKEENNKCMLLNKLINNITYTGGGTYTLGAFKIAKNIFEQARKASNKVLFLITDGFSNGGSPVTIAKDLKEKNVTIFTIGIRNGNYKELYQLSSDPGEYHSFLLDSFNQFESLARRALHVDLQTGEYISLGSSKPCDSLCKEGNCCDQKALCTCGTSTGHYSCVCEPGYYGSGLQNDCSPCPKNTFANGPNLCLPCPDPNHIAQSGSNGPESCQCKTGYQSTQDHRCEVQKCSKLLPPEHGYFVKERKCANVLNSACGIRCEIGYTLEGTSIRLCQPNATWSGQEPTCLVKTCEALSAPSHGTIICKHYDLNKTYSTEPEFPVDTVCSFACQRGRTLVGSRQRTCLPLAHWDGLKTSCKQVKCSKLSKIQFGKIEPKSCQNGKQPFEKVCIIKCDEGFELDGPEEKTCSGLHGNWNTKLETKCKDETKPQLVCPQNIRNATSLGKNYGHAIWAPINVTDNSGLNVTTWTKPSIKDMENFKFKMGTTNITYFAQDFQRNIAKCNFIVEIYDNEKPTIENCVDPPSYLSPEKLGTNISWEEPDIYDNSQYVKVEKSHNFGFFKIGTTSVIYTATDLSNNVNVCILNITVEEMLCEPVPTPNFGQYDCQTLDNSVQCVITCQEGYALPIPLQSETINVDSSDMQYICHNDNPQSSAFAEDKIFPECTVTELPLELNQSFTVHTQPENTEEICNDTKQLNELNKNISNALQSNLNEACNDIHCDIKTISECEDAKEADLEEEESNVIKRDVKGVTVQKPKKKPKKKKKITVKVHVKAKNKKGKRKRLDKIKSEMKHMQTLDGNPVTLINVGIATIYCPDGCVTRKQRCVRCPLGTFHNRTINVCQSCELGYYSDKEGQSECSSCPSNFSTRRLHSKSKTDCVEKCPPGKVGRRKVIKTPKNHPDSAIERVTLPPYCRYCPIGEYQQNFGEYQCLKCPEGFTTTSIGGTSINDCVPTIQSICSNSTTCNNGLCVLINNFYYSCECDKLHIGSHCETKINSCSYNPCTNGATCTLTHDEAEFSCSCPEGFSGPICETIEEKCSLTCRNNGTCLFSDEGEFCSCFEGFGGENCEVKLRFCPPGICENNGTCIEENLGYTCLCQNGFFGKRCTDLPCDFQPCPTNSYCENLNTSKTVRNAFRCECVDGYTGMNCTEKINPCSKSNCLNNATCRNIDYKLYTCECKPGFYGEFCEQKDGDKFVLSFTRASVTDSVRLDGFKFDLKQISVCLWIHTLDNFNYGTVLSYATRQYDNAFTITDYAGLVFYINNKTIITDIKLNDGFWHYFCFTWSGDTGDYYVYVDGKVTQKGNNFAKEEHLKANGKMIIGQEQDVMGGRFSQSEAFLGKLAEFDVWSRILTSDEIQHLMHTCGVENYGDVYSWPTLKQHIYGNVEVGPSPFCQKCRPPNSLFNGNVEVVNNTAYYKCNKGFTLSETIYSKGRKCNKATEWEGQNEPFCRYVYCGYPGSFLHGKTVGRQYTYMGQVKYVCNYGYRIVGDNVRTCSEDGTWIPDEPKCEGNKCKAFNLPDNSKIMVVSDYSVEYAEGVESYYVGTSIEIICESDAKLVGENLLSCMPNGEWDYALPECIPIKRKPPDIPCSISHIPAAPENGFITEESKDAVMNGTSNIIEYRCRKEYKMIGENTTTCIVDGYWTEPNISCQLIQCPKPPKIKNAQIREGVKLQYDLGNIVTYDCNKGYKFQGDPIITCMETGRWTRFRGRCIKISCGKPDTLETTEIQGSSYLFSEKVVLKCGNNKKYILTCDSTGSWIGEQHSSC